MKPQATPLGCRPMEGEIQYCEVQQISRRRFKRPQMTSWNGIRSVWGVQELP
jgi:hypothetical protein